MGKSELTRKLEKEIYRRTKRTGVFGCFEVTIGFFGDERVDYMTYDTKGIFRCYEIKASKEDFFSKNKTTFVGHYNYYVIPAELYNKVSRDIRDGIGVYTLSDQGMYCIQTATKMPLSVGVDVLKDSLIRSLYRECRKRRGKTDLTDHYEKAIEKYGEIIQELKDAKKKWELKYYSLVNELAGRFGANWRDKLVQRKK